MLNIKRLYTSLEELSNKQIQIDLWLNGSTKYQSSFEEACCGVFDDGNLTHAIDKGYIEKEFSSELNLMIWKLDYSLNFIPINQRPEDIINHPAMKIIREISAGILKKLKKEISKKRC